MKRNIFFLLLASALISACSSDNENPNDLDPTSAIVGSWRATEFKAADPNSSNVNLGAEILDKLTGEECYIIAFTFNQDLTVTGESGVNYLQINATATGLDVPCPTQRDTESSTYTYDGSVLTIMDSDGVSQSIKVTIEGNVMNADAGDLDIPNFDSDGELVFEKI